MSVCSTILESNCLCFERLRTSQHLFMVFSPRGGAASQNRVAVEAAAQVFGDDVYDSSALRTILQRVDREK